MQNSTRATSGYFQPKNAAIPLLTRFMNRATVELQALIDHTVERIFKVQTCVLDTLSEKLSQGTLRLYSKWGLDGSGGHFVYNQVSEDANLDEKQIFATAFVPLRVCLDVTENVIMWDNPRPNSTNYCRPVRFCFEKETPESTLQEVRRMEEQIQNLGPSTFSVNNVDYKVEHDIKMTMVDGKVCNVVTGTKSTLACNVCGASSTNINNIDETLARPVKPTALSYGLSTLHAWIRFFEYFLHLAYRLNTKRWQVCNLVTDKTRCLVSSTSNQIYLEQHFYFYSVRYLTKKQQLKDKKTALQERFTSRELGLHVDEVRQGGRNTARRFFRDPEKSAAITKLNVSLIKRCGTAILQVSFIIQRFDAQRGFTHMSYCNKKNFRYFPQDTQ